MTLALFAMIIGWVLALAMISLIAIGKNYAKQEADKKLKKEIGYKEEPLYKDLDVKIYDAFIHKKPEIVARKIGINAEEYYKNCELIRKPANLKGLIAKIGLSAMTVLWFTVVGLITKNWYVSIAGILIGLFLIVYLVKRPEEQAADVRAQIVAEMPRFLDMLQTALYINMPVEEAISITAKHLKGTLLADEFAKTVAEIQLGAFGWQTALENMSHKYEVDIFSDFVLDIVTAYDKGIPIYDVVARKNKEIKQTNLLTLKENASKLNSTIVIPIAIFKLLPLIVILCIPIIYQLRDTGVF